MRRLLILIAVFATSLIAATASIAQGASLPHWVTVHDLNGDAAGVEVGIVSFARPLPYQQAIGHGQRLIAVKFHIHAEGAAGVSGDANNAASVIGTNGQVYTASFINIHGCTNFQDGEFNITGHTTQAGCVTFIVPDRVGVRAIQFKIFEDYAVFRT